MNLYSTLAPLNTPNGTSVALGYFDGVHLGHRSVIGAACDYARKNALTAALFTFALPETGGFKGRRILASAEKRRRIASLGVEEYVRPPFADFAGLSPEAFVGDVLKRDFDAKAVFCGDNFTFGKNKAGTVQTLQMLCKSAGIEVFIVPMASWQGELISSTRLRAALAKGEIEDVNAMLGEDYALEFPVQHGKAIGRTLGFPTINQVYPEGMQLPQSGVYITEVTLQDGRVLPGATGLGTRPTVNGTGITCETFLPNFDEDIYGETVRVRFCKFLKPTLKFTSVDALAQYIESAADASLAYFEIPREKQ